MWLHAGPLLGLLSDHLGEWAPEEEEELGKGVHNYCWCFDEVSH